MNPQRKSNTLQLVLFTTATLLVIVSIASLAAAQEYNTRQKTVVMPSEQKLPRSLPQQRLFRGVRRRKMGIRKRKQMASPPIANPSPSNFPEFMVPSTASMTENTREEKKIDQPNGKLVRRKVMRRKRPLPTVMSPLPYQGNRRVSSQQNNVLPSNYNLTVKSPNFVNEAQNANDITVKKLRRKKIPVVINSSKVVTYRPKTTPMMPIGNTSILEQENALNRTEDEKRFLSLFTIVTFKNEACASTAGSNGTCYSSSDCSKLGGTASGTCASGFGVCCLFTKTCGESTSQNCTYFQNSGYPSTYDNVGSCQLTINKCSSNVCQLRLDFDNFVLAQPESTDHVCQNDQFVVSGGPPIPAVCGVNTGLHMYVDMGLASNAPIMLTSVTSGASFSRSFSIKVTQIDCYSLSKAADGCLQYFTGVSGQMRSFNYNDAAGLQLSNTDYTMCVRTERNFCGIQYTACPDTVTTPNSMAFSITGQNSNGTPNQGTVTDSNCSTDWLSIPCATNSLNPTAQTPSGVCVDRICGMIWNSVTQGTTGSPLPVNSFRTPFNIVVHTDSTEGSAATAETLNRGFCLDFVQQPCSTTSG